MDDKEINMEYIDQKKLAESVSNIGQPWPRKWISKDDAKKIYPTPAQPLDCMEEKSLFDQPSDVYLDIIAFGKPYVDLTDGREGFIFEEIKYMEPKTLTQP